MPGPQIQFSTGVRTIAPPTIRMTTAMTYASASRRGSGVTETFGPGAIGVVDTNERGYQREFTMMTARPLTSEEGQSWRLMLRANTKLLAQLDRELDDEAGISLADFGVLSALAEGPAEGVRMTQLAELSLHSKSRLSHCVDRLTSLGLVRRERALEDKRGFRAVLTSDGRRTLVDSGPRHAAGVQHYLLGHMTDQELATLCGVWTRVIELVERETPPLVREAGNELVASYA